MTLEGDRRGQRGIDGDRAFHRELLGTEPLGTEHFMRGDSREQSTNEIRGTAGRRNRRAQGIS